MTPKEQEQMDRVREKAHRIIEAKLPQEYTMKGIILLIVEEILSIDGIAVLHPDQPKLDELLTEDLVEPIVNFYILDDNKKQYAFDVWRQVKRKLNNFRKIIGGAK